MSKGETQDENITTTSISVLTASRERLAGSSKVCVFATSRAFVVDNVEVCLFSLFHAASADSWNLSQMNSQQDYLCLLSVVELTVLFGLNKWFDPQTILTTCLVDKDWLEMVQPQWLTPDT